MDVDFILVIFLLLFLCQTSFRESSQPLCSTITVVVTQPIAASSSSNPPQDEEGEEEEDVDELPEKVLSRTARPLLLREPLLLVLTPESPVEIEGVNKPLKGANEASKEAVTKST